MTTYFYGTKTHHIDVTDIVLTKCLDTDGNFQTFPASMNQLFSDPCPNRVKHLYCKDAAGTIVQSIHEHKTIFPKYRLACGAIFKNESWNMKEWLDHYLREGVEHFYLIDNGSTDDYERILHPYIEQDLVTLFKDPKPHIQEKAYNEYIKPVATQDTEWLIICDLDEFVYSRKSYPTIRDYLDTLSPDVSIISLLWKMFGSNGHIKHPDGLIKNFTQRKLYNGRGTTAMGIRHVNIMYTKNIIRVRYVRSIRTHASTTAGGICMRSDGHILHKNHVTQRISEEILDNSVLHMNHYAIQSQEFFNTVKKTRQSANNPRNDNVRNDAYFRRYDWNEHTDTELRDKVYKIIHHDAELEFDEKKMP